MFTKKKYMRQFVFTIFRMAVCIGCILSAVTSLHAQAFQLQTAYAKININGKGFITSIKNNKTGKEYCPKGMSSALMSLERNGEYILPVKALYRPGKQEIELSYANGSVAIIKTEEKKQYLRLQLLS